MAQTKDLAYWKANAEENYLTTPISVLRYITELEDILITIKANKMENNVEEVKQEQPKKVKPVKPNYLVTTRTLGGIKGTVKPFRTLRKARQIGMQHFRNGSFVKLTNAKGTKLTL